MKILLSALALALAVTGSGPDLSAGEAEDVAQAKQLFKNYQNLEANFDPAVLDLYVPAAQLWNIRKYPNGTERTMELTKEEYSPILIAALPLAKQRGDTNTDSDCTFTPEKSEVRIRCTRHSNLKNYDSPIELLVGSNLAGEWKIFLEISESRP